MVKKISFARTGCVVINSKGNAKAAWSAATGLGALALLVTLSACAQPSVDRAGQARLIDEYINARYDRVEYSLERFEYYVGLVLEQKDIPEAVFHDGRAMLLIVDGGKQDLVAQFVASSQGGDLSDTERAHFQRTLALREVRAGELYDAVFERLDANGAGRLASELNLLSLFIGGLDMREYLEQIPDELLLECAGQIRAAMLDFDRGELWEALANRDGEPLQRYLESGPLPTLEYLTALQIRPVVQDHVRGPLEHIGRSLLASALGQAFALHLHGMEFAALKLSGFNELMGAERAERLHARAMWAVQAVEQAAQEASDKDMVVAGLARAL